MKVYVEGFDAQYEEMFQRRGHEVVEKVEEADLVQFVGGADVNPSLYGEEPHPATSFSDIADKRSINLYENAITHGIPMAGICRGGQFLNVMNGGKMYQHVDNHALYGTHTALDVESASLVQVTSTHHQMMIPAFKRGVVVATAEVAYAVHRLEGGRLIVHCAEDLNEDDTEAVWYEDNKCLCFQPHPEIVDKDHECQEYYFELLQRYFKL